MKSFRDDIDSQSLRIRGAKPEDMMIYYTWATDSSVRDNSYDSSSIPLETHQAWFSRKLTDPMCLLYVLEYQKTPVGQIRFEKKASQVEIGFSIDKEFRGKGLGTAILKKGVEYFISQGLDGGLPIVGFVKRNNRPSVRAFLNAGFTQQEEVVVAGVPSFKFVHLV